MRWHAEAQVAVTPPPQWVRVVGGFTEHSSPKSACRRSTSSTPSRPTRRCSCCISTTARCSTAPRCARSATPRTRPSRPAARSCATRNGNPTGLLLAKPNANILYATLAKGPKLPFDYQVNSTRHFMRELNRLGVTGAIDAGGGFQNYPEDYAVIQKLSDDGQLTIRLAYNLFTQKPKGEKDDFLNWTKTSKYKQGTTISATTAPARCWCSPPPTSRISACRAPTCRRRWRASSKSRAHPGREPLALAAARDLRRDDQPRARRVRAREPGHPARGPATGSSIMPRRSRTSRSTASPRSAAASPCSTAWPIRANISSSATASARRSDAAGRAMLRRA
jgi:hypothetical protein